jgi:hypothetical protein
MSLAIDTQTLHHQQRIAAKRQAACAHKKRHKSRERALWAARGLKLNPTRTNAIGVYQCPFCKQWHVGGQR